MMRVATIGIFSVCMSLFVMSGTVAASPDWAKTNLWVDDFKIPSKEIQDCTYKDIHFQNFRYSLDRQLCIMQGKDWSASRLVFIDVGRDKMISTSVVSLNPYLDNKMYEVTPDIFDPHHGLDSWLQLQGSNDVLYLHSDRWDSGAEIYRYNDMPSKLSLNVVGNETSGYTFHQENFDFHLTRPNGEALHVAGLAISNNKKWAVMEAQDEGILILNLSTNTIKRVAPFIDDDWISFINDMGGLAISDDGMYVVMMTPDRQIVVKMDSGCGDVIGDVAKGYDPLGSSCTSRSLSNSLAAKGYEDSPRYANLVFGDGAQWLDFDAGYAATPSLAFIGEQSVQPQTGRARLTTIKPIELKYLALGDSYSSGEGDITRRAGGSGYYIGETDGRNGCHLSSRSYPYLLRDKWHMNPNTMRSVACSGAKVMNDYNYSFFEEYFGQHGQLRSDSESERATNRTKALNNFTPGVLEQIEFVDRYKPDVVTFTGGGNDAGFADVISYCASPDIRWATVLLNTCSYASDAQLRADLNRTIDNQYTGLRNFVENMQYVSPATKFYIVGYPQFVSSHLIGCTFNSPLLNTFERKMIRESVTRMNNILKKVARDTGVYYVDIEESLEGGEICQGSAYMTGPVKVGAGKLSSGYVQEAYHPNAAGHAKIAEKIYTVIDTDTDYQILDIPEEINGRHTEKRAVMSDYAGVGSTQTITMTPDMFKPDGTVTIEMFSNKVQLGQVTTDSTGAFTTEVKLPEAIGMGMHLLLLTGEDTNGESLVIQQFITVTSGISGDIDGDGIPDDQDKCDFITEWYQDGVNLCADEADAKNAIGDQFSRKGDSTGRTPSGVVSNSSHVENTPTETPEGGYGNQPIVASERAANEKAPQSSWVIPIIVSVACIIGIIFGGVYVKRKKA